MGLRFRSALCGKRCTSEDAGAYIRLASTLGEVFWGVWDCGWDG
jgi:hypothetical protein